MYRFLPRLIVLLLAVVLAPTGAVAAPASAPDAGVASALHILRQECSSCHNAEKKKGGLLLTSREAILKGGDSGPAMALGKPSDSLLIQSLTPDADPHMPPKKQLPPEAIATLTEWVKQGAPWDASLLVDAPATRPIVYQALPKTYSPVMALALSPDGKTLAVGRGNEVHLYPVGGKDAKPPVALTTLQGPRDAVQALAWSPDGRLLAAGDHARVLVWEVAKPAETPIELQGLTGRVTAVQFLPGSDTLVAADGGAGSNAQLHLYRLPDRQPAISVEAHADTIAAIAVDRAGNVLATAGGDKTVRLWTPATLKPVATLEGHTGRVSTVAFNPDGSQLASGSADRDVKTWDVKTYERLTSTGPHPAAVTAIAWPVEKSAIVVCEDGSVRLNGPEKKPSRPFADAADDVLYTLAASPDGKTVFAGCHDGQVYVWIDGKLQTKLSPTETER